MAGSVGGSGEPSDLNTRALTWLRADGSTLLAWTIFGIAAVAGIFARIHGLGQSPLAVDEYYTLVSTEAVFRTGLPEFPSGGYYVRGLLQQYVTAPLLGLLEDPDLALRIPSVVFGLATVPVAYLYGRRVGGKHLGLTLAALLMVSSWQIEFSRFGRMYALLQLLTLAFLLRLHITMEEPVGRTRYLPHILAVLAVLTHALGLFLLPLLFLPLLAPESRARLGGARRVAAYAAAGAVAGLASLQWYRTSFRNMGVSDRFPADLQRGGGGGGSGLIDLPSFPLVSGLDAPVLILGGVALVGALLAWLWWRGRLAEEEAWGAFFLVTAVTHLLVVAGLSALVLVARHRIHRRWRARPRVAGAFAAGALICLAWVVYATARTYLLQDRSWIAEAGAFLFRDGFRHTFIWPDPSAAIVNPWAQEMPVLGSLLAAAFLHQLFAAFRRPGLGEVLRHPAVLLLYFVASLGLFTPTYEVTRYTFFLYPLALTVLLLALWGLVGQVGRRLKLPTRRAAVALPAALLLFGASEDLDPAHLADVTDPEATYRTGRFHDHEATWYDRDDFASAAEFVEGRAGDREPIVVVEVPPVSYYLEREHAVYMDRQWDRFANVTREGGRLDLWSNHRLLSTPEELARYSGEDGTVWIVRDAELQPFEPEEVWRPGTFLSERVYVTPDSALEVLRVERAPTGEPTRGLNAGPHREPSGGGA